MQKKAYVAAGIGEIADMGGTVIEDDGNDSNSLEEIDPGDAGMGGFWLGGSSDRGHVMRLRSRSSRRKRRSSRKGISARDLL